MLLTTASTSKPKTSSIAAAARMILLEARCSRPLLAGTCAVIPTLVATMAAPTKMASVWPTPQARRIPQPIRKGTITPATATMVAVAGVIVPFLMGWGILRAWGVGHTEAIFVGAAMVATSVGITAQVPASKGLLHLASSKIILAAAAIDD